MGYPKILFFGGIYFCGIWGTQPFVCKGVWKIAKPPKFGFSLSKQRMADILQMQLFSRGPVVHFRVKVEVNFNVIANVLLMFLLMLKLMSKNLMSRCV